MVNPRYDCYPLWKRKIYYYEHLRNIFDDGELNEKNVSWLCWKSSKKKDSNDHGRLGTKLSAFLQFNEYEILNNSGKVTAEIAKAFAESEYEKYRIVQDRLFESDFERLLKETEKDRGE